MCERGKSESANVDILLVHIVVGLAPKINSRWNNGES